MTFSAPMMSSTTTIFIDSQLALNHWTTKFGNVKRDRNIFDSRQIKVIIRQKRPRRQLQGHSTIMSFPSTQLSINGFLQVLPSSKQLLSLELIGLQVTGKQATLLRPVLTSLLSLSILPIERDALSILASDLRDQESSLSLQTLELQYQNQIIQHATYMIDDMIGQFYQTLFRLKSLESLYLTGFPFFRTYLETFRKIQTTCRISELQLRKCHISSVEDIRTILSAFGDSNCLTRLDISSNNIPVNAELMKIILLQCRNLNTLVLTHNSAIKNASMQRKIVCSEESVASGHSIYDLLCQNTTLREVWIDHGGSESDGNIAESIHRALVHANTTLTKIVLVDSRFSWSDPTKRRQTQILQLLLTYYADLNQYGRAILRTQSISSIYTKILEQAPPHILFGILVDSPATSLIGIDKNL
jgi:hypothetical protein